MIGAGRCVQPSTSHLDFFLAGGLAANDPSAVTAGDAAEGVAAEAGFDDAAAAPEPPRNLRTRCSVLSFWML